jgi:DNA-binding GntR family transcriptional regulator
MQVNKNMQITPIVRSETLKEAAYNGIKQLLTSGQLEPDIIYSANQFAEILEVSRTPVREALLQLVIEGFLVTLGGRGFKIKIFTEKEIRDFFEVRRIVESGIVEGLVDVLDATDLKQLSDLMEQMKTEAANGNAHGFLDADKNFHMYLIHRHDNFHLLSIMDNVRDLIASIGHQAMSHEERYQEVIQEHEQLLEALKQKNKAQAVQAMRCHLSTTEKYLLEQFKTDLHPSG